MQTTRNFWKLHIIELEEAAEKAIENREDIWNKIDEMDEDISQKKTEIKKFLSIVERTLVE